MDLAPFVHGKDPKISAHLVATATTRVNLYELNQALDLNTLFGTGAKLDVTSSSANDASAGTGAQEVTVYGLDTNWKPLTEVVSLNGQTIVTTSNSFRRVFAAAVTKSGSGGKAAGDIYIVKTGTGGTYANGVPGTLTSALVKIVLDEGTGWAGYWTVPAGAIAKIMALVVSVSAQNCRLQIQVQPNLDTDNNSGIPIDIELSSSGAFEGLDINEYLEQFDAGTDIVLLATPAASGAKITVTMHLNQVQTQRGV